MTRYYDDWLKGFMDYAKFGEAPSYMYFWTGVSAIAGALRRKVWIDQAYFKWYPNFYIVLVAPPGIVAKSTTASVGMNLLRKVEGIKFGPDIVTWQALVSAFAEASEHFQYDDAYYPMSPLTLESSEFGNLFDPKDKDMVDLFVTLWDGKQGSLTKGTIYKGTEEVENPWINMIACTTPAWIAGNFPDYLIGGGFTSRCLFVYADQKAQYTAYPCKNVPANLKQQEKKLIADLTKISQITGEYKLTDEAFEWGEKWYKKHYAEKPIHLDDERFGGYLARKQTHMHKLAMILSASESDELVITRDHLELSYIMVTDLESDMTKVFSKIGKSDVSFYTDKIITYVEKKEKASYAEVYRYVHAEFPFLKDFENVLLGCAKAGFLRMEKGEQGLMVVATKKSSMAGKV